METTQNTTSVLRQPNTRSLPVHQNNDGTRNIQYLALQLELQQKNWKLQLNEDNRIYENYKLYLFLL